MGESVQDNQKPQAVDFTKNAKTLLSKYKRIERSSRPDDGSVRISAQGGVAKYVTKLLQSFSKGKQELTICATGMAIGAAISVCEVTKRRQKGLHQVTEIRYIEIVDEYEPLEPGLERRIEKHSVPSIRILLTMDGNAVDKNDSGYQAPLDESLVEEQRNYEEGKRRRPRRYVNHSAHSKEGDAQQQVLQQSPNTTASSTSPQPRDSRPQRGRGHRRRNRGRGAPRTNEVKSAEHQNV